ncbi:hypothetical protein HMPREF1147_0116 [Selenomonas sp. FOBRC9]|uniref:hypothetical protein n=1 Tax=Selenomonas sp. FOBRC9 TaxID=936573 RepID=UPI00027A5D5A|nr:hypothetical protein [Selenomonas sp. FOBRC9]EJP29052.1 hypothetical protein HMPREF1147_0116 [Selenomonas sp. FOBRC9]
MRYDRLARIGLTEEELAKELSAQPLTAETIAAAIARNNAEIMRLVNGALDSLAASIDRTPEQRP